MTNRIEKARRKYNVPEPGVSQDIEGISTGMRAARTTAHGTGRSHNMNGPRRSQTYPDRRPETPSSPLQPSPPLDDDEDDDDIPAPFPLSRPPLSYEHQQNSQGRGDQRHSEHTSESSLPAENTRNLTLDTLSNPSSPDNLHTKSGQEPGIRREEGPERPTLSFSEARLWMQNRKNGVHGRIPGRENLTYLGERDHIFIIDHSETMASHRENVAELTQLLAYILKESDEDGLDIHFVHTVRKINSKKSSRLYDEIRSAPFRGTSNMHHSLSRVLDDHPNKFEKHFLPSKKFFAYQPPLKLQRSLSVYVLTDGKWQPTGNVGNLIKGLVSEMMTKGCKKEKLAFQFIRFGEDQAGIKQLDELDCGLGLKALGMDIVDHTYWAENLWKQLLGALNDWYDDDPP